MTPDKSHVSCVGFQGDLNLRDCADFHVTRPGASRAIRVVWLRPRAITGESV
jgi:hypothetical protein